MRVVSTDSLQEGMLLAEDIYAQDKVVLKKGTFLQLPNILFLKNL